MTFPKQVADILQVKPIQQGLQALLLGTVLGGGMWIAKKVVSSSKGSTLTHLVEECPEVSGELKAIQELDPDFVELFARFLQFRKYESKAYDELVEAVLSACTLRNAEYEATQIKAAASARIRGAFQKVIESTRLWRSILEIRIPVVLEDFDEVAVDLNSKVEIICQDAIQDTFT